MRKRALVSVYDKSGINELASYLAGAGWEILSTGGTARYLAEAGFPVTDVASVTGFPECLDGRVKTLHPAVHAGLLARRDDPSHMETLDKLGLGTIDMVCVNLYPFFEKVQAGLSVEETIEFIDIGGPTMLRSAAKNYRDVVVLTDPADYDETLAALGSGGPGTAYKKYLAGKVFNLTSAYDAAVARYLLELDSSGASTAADLSVSAGVSTNGAAETTPGSAGETAAKTFPPFWPVSVKKAQDLRYGENGHQRAALYLASDRPGALGGMEQLNGKELGYNNIRDLDLAWKAACAFGFPPEHKRPLGEEDLERAGIGGRCGGVSPAKGARGSDCFAIRGFPPPACVAVKHNTPCGAATGATLLDAYEKAYACDPVSIFGGIVACTVKVDRATAERLGELFLEIVAAPDFDDDALALLSKKKNLRVMRGRYAPRDSVECIAVDGGLLVQEADRRLVDKWEVVSKAAPEPEDIADMVFGMRAAAYVKSNAIVVVKDAAAVGIGGGQTNRIWAAEAALLRGKEAVLAAAENPALTGKPIADGKPARVLASDAFFPFADVVEAAAAAGIKAIVQSGGSIRDRESIEACDRRGIAMVFTGMRHFKH